jgi:uncharacterized membrane protein YccC
LIEWWLVKSWAVEMAPPALNQRLRFLIQVAVAIVSLLAANQIAHPFGIPRAAGLLCLASLAALVVCVRLGWRQALLGLAGLALLSMPAALSQSDPWMATGVIALSAFALGISARWQLQQVYWLMVVSLCLLMTNSPFTGAPSVVDVIRLAAAVLLAGGLTILLQTRLVPCDPSLTATDRFAIAHSWRRSVAYGLLLASTTLVSTPLAVQHHWHITGLWLILTPFLVLRPFVRDAWKVALHRSLGTIAGVLLVMVLALFIPKSLPLQVPGIVLGVMTAMIAIRRGHPAIVLMALTVTIVLFNSNHVDLMRMADRRLEAVGLGVVLALGVMAIAHPIEQRFSRSLLHERS